MSICVYYSASRNRKSLDSRLALGFAWLNPTYNLRDEVGWGKMPRLQGLFAQLILFGGLIPPYSYDHCVGDADLRPYSVRHNHGTAQGPSPTYASDQAVAMVDARCAQENGLRSCRAAVGQSGLCPVHHFVGTGVFRS